MRKPINLIIAVCVLRLLTNMSKLVVSDDNQFAIIFLFGALVFELFALVYWERKVSERNSWQALFLDFCIGANLYAIYKLCWADPHSFTMWEYWGLLIGIIYSALKYVYAKLS